MTVHCLIIYIIIYIFLRKKGLTIYSANNNNNNNCTIVLVIILREIVIISSAFLSVNSVVLGRWQVFFLFFSPSCFHLVGHHQPAADITLFMVWLTNWFFWGHHHLTNGQFWFCIVTRSRAVRCSARTNRMSLMLWRHFASRWRCLTREYKPSGSWRNSMSLLGNRHAPCV